MLGRKGHTPTPAPQPPPQPQPPQPDDEVDVNSDDFGDSQFTEWDEAYIAGS
jgi:hypothetical protein